MLVEASQARAIATALAGLADDGSRVKLLGDGVEVELALTTASPAVAQTGPVVRVAGYAADWRAAAIALGSGLDVEQPIRINIC